MVLNKLAKIKGMLNWLDKAGAISPTAKLRETEGFLSPRIEKIFIIIKICHGRREWVYTLTETMIEVQKKKRNRIFNHS